MGCIPFVFSLILSAYPLSSRSDVLCREKLTQIARLLHTDAAYKRFDLDGVLETIRDNGKDQSTFEDFQKDLEYLLWGAADAQIPEFKIKLQEKYGFNAEMVDLLDIGLAHFFEDTRIARMDESELLEKVRFNFRAYDLERNPIKRAEYFYLLSQITNRSVPELAVDLGVTEKALYQKLSDYGISIEEAFSEPLSHFQVKKLKELFPRHNFDDMTLHEAVTLLQKDRKLSMEQAAQTLSIGPQALDFYLHFAKEKNRGVKWDREVPPLGISEEAYLRRMIAREMPTQEIADNLNRYFDTHPDSEDYRSAASVTAKAASLGLIGGNSRIYDQEVYDDIGRLLKKGNRLLPENAIAFLNEHYFMPISWLSNRLGVTPQALYKFGVRHSIPLKDGGTRISKPAGPPKKPSPTTPKKESLSKTEGEAILVARGEANLEFERNRQLGVRLSELLSEAGITDREPKSSKHLKNPTPAQIAEQKAYTSIGNHLEKPGFIEGVTSPVMQQILRDKLQRKRQLEKHADELQPNMTPKEKKEFIIALGLGEKLGELLSQAGITDREPKTHNSKNPTPAQIAEQKAYESIRIHLEKPGFIEGVKSPFMQQIVREKLQRKLEENERIRLLEKRADEIKPNMTAKEKKELIIALGLGEKLGELLSQAGITDREPKNNTRLTNPTPAQIAEESAYDSILMHLEKPGFIEGVASPIMQQILREKLQRRLEENERKRLLEKRADEMSPNMTAKEKKEFIIGLGFGEKLNELLSQADITDREPRSLDLSKIKIPSPAQIAEKAAYNLIQKHLEKPGFIEGITNPVMQQIFREKQQRNLDRRRLLEKRANELRPKMSPEERKELLFVLNLAENLNDYLMQAGITDREPKSLALNNRENPTPAQIAEQTAYSSIAFHLEKPGFIEGVTNPIMQQILRDKLQRKRILEKRADALRPGMRPKEKKEFIANLSLAETLVETLIRAGISDREPKVTKHLKSPTPAQIAEQAAYSSIAFHLEKPGFIEGVTNPIMQQILRDKLQRRHEEKERKRRLEKRADEINPNMTPKEKKEFLIGLVHGDKLNGLLIEAGITDREPKQHYSKNPTAAQIAEQRAFDRIRANLEKPGFIEGVTSPIMQQILRDKLENQRRPKD